MQPSHDAGGPQALAEYRLLPAKPRRSAFDEAARPDYPGNHDWARDMNLTAYFFVGIHE